MTQEQFKKAEKIVNKLTTLNSELEALQESHRIDIKINRITKSDVSLSRLEGDVEKVIQSMIIENYKSQIFMLENELEEL